MNRKGFTLIELLAVIILFGLVLVFVVPNIVDTYENSKLKTEKVFIDKLSDIIDGYIYLNSGDFNFVQDGVANKEGQTGTVTIYKNVITINEIIEEKLISENDYINSSNKDVKCNKNAELEVYKDSDYVYCHKIKKESLDCLTKDFKDSIIDDYVIDTCLWSR